MNSNSRILLVEPDGIVQVAEYWALKQWGAEIDIAQNGSQALDKVLRKKYDYILFDACLDNGQEGFEVVNAIKSSLINKKTPCAILGFDEELENMKKASDLGVWYFIKPITPSDAKSILEMAKESL